jgi:hypothetical protein
VVTGGITGLTWDRDTGYAIAGAQIRAVGPSALPVLAISAPGGMFDVTGLAAGHYTLHGEWNGQTVEVHDVEVVTGEVTFAKLPFTPAHPELTISDDATSLSRITRSHRDELGAAGRIEGFVIDGTSHATIAGAVVTVRVPADPSRAVQQTSSDERGAFHIDGVAPGSYEISAYYSVAQHGQIEVRRGSVEVGAGDVVDVPLIIEAAR